jgi:hypothetical protein
LEEYNQNFHTYPSYNRIDGAATIRPIQNQQLQHKPLRKISAGSIKSEKMPGYLAEVSNQLERKQLPTYSQLSIPNTINSLITNNTASKIQVYESPTQQQLPHYSPFNYQKYQQSQTESIYNDSQKQQQQQYNNDFLNKPKPKMINNYPSLSYDNRHSSSLSPLSMSSASTQQNYQQHQQRQNYIQYPHLNQIPKRLSYEPTISTPTTNSSNYSLIDSPYHQRHPPPNQQQQQQQQQQPVNRYDQTKQNKYKSYKCKSLEPSLIDHSKIKGNFISFIHLS